MNNRMTTAAVIVSLLAAAPALAAPVHDPEGDAIAPFGGPPPLIDIDTVNFQSGDATLFFSISFYTPVSAPSQGLDNGVVGEVHIDVDQNPATGGLAGQDQWGGIFPMIGIGAEYNLWLSSEENGEIQLLDTATGKVVGMVPVTYGPLSVSGAIPLSLLGNDDGQVDYGVLVGTDDHPTDAIDTVGSSGPLGAPADFNGDGLVNAADLALLLGAWGECPMCDFVACPQDINQSCTIDAADLALLLGSWTV